MFNFESYFPWSNAHELNLDWIISQVKRCIGIADGLDERVSKNEENIAINTADIEALKNNPNFAGDWDASKSYRYLTVVYDPKTGNSYTALKDVPAGTPLTNTEYWALTGNFNQQLKDVMDKLSGIEVKLEDVTYVVANKAELKSKKFDLDSYVLCLCDKVLGDGGMAVYKVVSDDKVYTPAEFKIASGKAVLQAKSVVNVAQFDGYNFADVFNFVLSNYKEVHLSYGEYHADKPIIVKENVIIGSEDIQMIPDAPRVTVYGQFIVEGQAYIQGIYCEGWETGLSGAGFTINTRCKLVGCVSQNWDIGFHSTTKNFTVGLIFDTCRASDCKQYGFYIEGSNTASKNITTITNCYANKCGSNVYDYDVPGTPDTGHGYYIKQSVCLNFTNNTAEYNSGYGLLLNPSYTSSIDFSYIDGATITNNYFEQNKMCQIGVDADTYGSIKNTTFADNYFVMPQGLMSNTKTNGNYWFSNFDIFNEEYNNSIDVGVFTGITTYRAFSRLAYKYGTTAYYNVNIKKKLDRDTTEFECRYSNPTICRIEPNQVYAIKFTWWLESGKQYIITIVDGAGQQLNSVTLTGTDTYQNQTIYVSSDESTTVQLKISPYQSIPQILYMYDFSCEPANIVYGDSKPSHPQTNCVSINSSKDISIYNGSSWI